MRGPRRKEEDWTESQKAMLVEDWSTHPASAIAIRVHKTKHAVLGKAHRMGLPSKDSPILTEGAGTPRAPLCDNTDRMAAGSEPLRAGHPISWGAICLGK